MGYSAQADIESEFKNLTFTSTTNVTDSDVTKFIAEAGALINSYVGTRYVVPITANADTLALMNLYCTTLVADRIKKILEVKQITNSAANQEVRGAFGTKNVMDALIAIQKGSLALAGATLVAGTTGVFYSDNYERGAEATFKKDCEQW